MMMRLCRHEVFVKSFSVVCQCYSAARASWSDEYQPKSVFGHFLTTEVTEFSHFTSYGFLSFGYDDEAIHT